jgi:S-adenosylmethionine:tRNA ribosyltransferase-isomerase
MTRILLQDTSDPPTGDHSGIPERFRLSTYQYPLPPELIAQEPAAARDESRLLAVHRESGILESHVFRELPTLLKPSDLLVFNETRVIPASLKCRKPSGGQVELLVLDPAAATSRSRPDEPAVRTCMARSSKPLKPGSVVYVEKDQELVVVQVLESGRVLMRFPVPEAHLLDFLDRYGAPPLPPYIKPPGRDHSRDRLRYQTVYARTPGSVAAPTAGLHFTKELIRDLESIGIGCARIVLHVGPGTFSPVRGEDLRLHKMESEFYEIPIAAEQEIRHAQEEGRRVIAVGTTAARALESATDDKGRVRAGKGQSDLFIVPGYRFRVIQGMITNFHLPGSTLMMLVCALAGTDLIRRAYEKAISERFRFYSYGDASLIID